MPCLPFPAPIDADYRITRSMLEVCLEARNPVAITTKSDRVLAAGAEAGALSASFISVRLPHEIAPLFRAWLDTHFPDRAGKVMSTIQDMRGGRDNDPDFGTRMRGQGPWAELIRTRFRIALKQAGMNSHAWRLSVDGFRPPADGMEGELFLGDNGRKLRSRASRSDTGPTRRPS